MKFNIIMTKICTDIKQSKRLIELGIDVNTADMCYLNDGTSIKLDANPYNAAMSLWYDHYVEIIPAWSLSALLELMPESINNNTEEFSQLEIYKHHVCYAFADGNVNIGKRGDILLDAVYEMIVWLKEKGKI